MNSIEARRRSAELLHRQKEIYSEMEMDDCDIEALYDELDQIKKEFYEVYDCLDMSNDKLAIYMDLRAMSTWQNNHQNQMMIEDYEGLYNEIQRSRKEERIDYDSEEVQKLFIAD